MLHSLAAHRGEYGLEIHYLHSPEVGRRARARLERMVAGGGGSIRFHAVPDREVAGLPTPDEFTPAMWYRILLPELLLDIDRVLYLDVDTVALDSLEALWETDISVNHVAAVTNVFEPWAAARPAELGLAGSAAYFNTGVMLMNLALMRRDGTSDALRQVAVDRGDELLWPDQDAFNLVLGHRRLALHPRWNCMNSVMHLPESIKVFGAETVAEARRRPAIRHFEGPGVNKPWHPHCDRALRDVYLAHREQTPWPLRLNGRAGESRTERTWRRVADFARRH